MNRFVFACIAVFAVYAGQAQAGVLLDGKTVGYQYLIPTTSDLYYQPADFVVGPGVELPALTNNTSDYATVDFSDTNIYVDFYGAAGFTSATFNGFRLYDSLNTIAPIINVTVNPVTNLAGFSAANVSFDADNVYVNFQGLFFDASTVVSLDLTPGAVPAPSTMVTWAGVMAVVAVVGVVRRRQAIACA